MAFVAYVGRYVMSLVVVGRHYMLLAGVVGWPSVVGSQWFGTWVAESERDAGGGS